MPDLAPANVDEAAEAMRHAARHKMRVEFVGGGTELGPGHGTRVLDVVLRTGRMARVLEYAPADMVIVTEAGVTLSQIQTVARAHRQMLALDAPHPERATLGGLVATAAFGPRRARYGGIRDLILGVTLVRADGVVAHGGGKVVKNVAGFDVPKVMCGSYGTLALIATATFRLHPLPEATATALVASVSAERASALVAELRRSQLEPSSVVALRLGDGSFDLGVRFEGFRKGVDQQIERFVDQAGAEKLADDTKFWSQHDAIRTGGPLRFKVGALPSKLPSICRILAPLLASLRGATFAWYATLGIGFVTGEPEEGTAAAILAARAALLDEGGWLVIEQIVSKLKISGSSLGVDPWGPVPPAFAIMKQLKQRFDPEGRLNPGRFVGGL